MIRRLSLAIALILITGCGPRYVVTPGGETIEVPKATLDELVRNQTALLDALDQCRRGGK